MIIKSHKKITDNRLFYMSAQELLLLYIVTLFISKRVNDSNIVKAIVLEWHWSQLGCMPAWHTGRTLSPVAGQKKHVGSFLLFWDHWAHWIYDHFNINLLWRKQLIYMYWLHHESKIKWSDKTKVSIYAIWHSNYGTCIWISQQGAEIHCDANVFTRHVFIPNLIACIVFHPWSQK